MNSLLLEFVFERENIRLKREAGSPAPWTDNLVLRKYKFTNVRRRDDRVSKWVIEKFIKPYPDAPDLWFTLFLVRLINWPPTLERLMMARALPTYPEAFDPQLFINTVERIKAEGGKVYGGAYMVFPTKKNKGGSKSQALCDHIISEVIKHAPQIRTSLKLKRIEPFVQAMSGCFGVSTFIAGQVAADLTYSPAQLGRAQDLYTFAPLGPGSQRGLNYLHKLAPFHTWKQQDFNNALIEVRESLVKNLGMTDLTLHDVQNCMCEYSKYCRTVMNEGVPKTTYKPETEF